MSDVFLQPESSMNGVVYGESPDIQREVTPRATNDNIQNGIMYGESPNVARIGDTYEQRRALRTMREKYGTDDGAMGRIEAAMYISHLTGRNPAALYRNIDQEVQQFFDYKTESPDGWAGIRTAIRAGWNNAKVDIEIGREMARALNTPGEEYNILQEAIALENNKEPEREYNGLAQALNWTANIAPYVVEIGKSAGIGLAAGAGIAALASATGGSGVALAAALGSKAARAGRLIGSFKESARVMAGLSFYQMLQAEDEDGNRIPVETARALSVGAGFLNGMLEAAQLDLLTGNPVTKSLFRRGARKALAGEAISGNGVRVALGALRTYGTNVGVETLQELAQESVDYFTYNAAVAMANDKNASAIPKQEMDEFINTLGQVAKQTAVGVGILGVPGATIETVRARTSQQRGADFANRVRDAVGDEVSPELAEAIENGDAEKIDSELRAAAERNPPKVSDVEIEPIETGYEARIRGEAVARFNLETDGDTVTFADTEITGLLSDEDNKRVVAAAATRMIHKIYEQTPNARFRFNEDNAAQAQIKRAIEDQLDDAREANKVIDSLQARREDFQAELDAYTEQAAQLRTEEAEDGEALGDREGLLADLTQNIEDVQSEISDIDAQLEKAVDYKTNFLDKKYFDNRDNWAMTTQEYNERLRNSQQYDQNFWHNTPSGDYVIQQLRQGYLGEVITDAEAHMFVELLSQAANRQGKSFEQYVKDTFVPGIVEANDVVDYDLRIERGNRASVRFMEDGRAIIAMARSGDFTSFVHEAVHVFRRQLTGDDLRIAAEWSGADSETNWSRAAEERFVNGFFQWANEKQEFSGPISRIFAHLKQFMDKLVEILHMNGALTDEMRGVYDRMFGEDGTVEAETFVEGEQEVRSELERVKQEAAERMEAIKTADGDIDELFQPAPPTDSDAFRKWFGDSKVVDENGDPLVVYHGTASQFGAFREDRAGIGTMTEDSSMGFFFSDSRNVAKEYAESRPTIPDLNTKPREVSNGVYEVDRFVEYDKETPIVELEIGTLNADGTVDVDGPFGEDTHDSLEDWQEFVEESNDYGLRETAPDYGMYGRYSTNANARVLDVYLRIENPAEVDREGQRWDAEEAFDYISQARDAGYDGIIVRNTIESSDDSPSTVYIAFSPNQIKSINNRGTWSRDDDRILYQPSSDHEADVREAVRNYEAVPIEVLQQYSDRDWAAAEIQRREMEDTRREELAWLYDLAESASTWEEYMESIPFEESVQMDDTLLEDVWHDASVTDINDGNQKWVNSLSDLDIKEIAEAAHKRIIFSTSKDLNLLHITQKPTERHMKSVRTYLLNNATRIRRQLATDWQQYHGDQPDFKALRQLRREQEKSEGIVDKSQEEKLRNISTEEIRRRLKAKRDSREWNKLRRSQVTMKTFDNIIKEADRRLKEDEQFIEQSRERQVQILSDLGMAAEIDAKTRRDIQQLLVTIQREIENPRNDGMIRRDVQQAVNNLTEVRTRVKRDGKWVTVDKNDLIKEYRQYRSAQERARRNREQTKAARKLANEQKKKARAILRSANAPSISAPIRQQITALIANHAEDFTLQSIEPTFRSKKKQEEINKIRRQMKADPKVLEGISDRDKILAGKKSLNEFTAEELDALYEEVMNLRELGRADKKRIDREQAALRDRVINGLEDALPYDYPAEIPAAEPGKKPQKVSFSEMRLDSYRPPRLADMLDGGEGFRGAHHDFFINRVNAAEDAKIRSMQKRRKWMIERLNKLGYEVDDRNISRVMSEVLAQEFGEANGTMYTLDEVLEIYAGFKNAKKRAAIIMGNGRDRILAEVRRAARDPEIDPDTAMVDAITQVENEYQALIDKLTDEQKQLADLVIEEYSENYDRIEQTNGYFYNAVLGFEENYTPIITRGRSTEVHEKQLAQELLVRSAYRRAGIDRGFSKERLKKIKIEHRRPINLGLFQHWEQTVAKQEHFIAYSEWSKLSNAILESDAGMNWRERIIQGSKQGEALLQQMKDYRSRVVQPNSFMSNDSTNRLLKYLRNNAAIAYLSFNMVTAMKQIPSLGFYLVEATPGDLLAAISTAARDWNGLRERALERNPQLISRSLDRDFAYLDKLASDPKALKAKRDLARFGTAMIRTFDAIAVTIGEEAVYNKALRDGMSQAEAAQLAQNVTLRTQPAGASKDSSKLFTKESLYLFTQFSNQLNQIWNMFTYDVPKAYGGSTYRRQKIATIASLAMSSYLIWALTNRQALPDEEEPLDFVNLVAGQFISAAPIVGPMIYSAMQGFTPETAVTSPFASIGSIAGISLQNIGEDLSDYERWKIVDSLFESAAIALGIPYIAPNRAIKAATGAIEGDLNFFETLSTAVTGDTWTVSGED